MKQDLILRLYNDSDKDNILDLMNSVFADQQRSAIKRSSDLWHWKNLDNPFGHSVMTVAEYHNEIVGVDNMWPWALSCRGKVLRALQPCDSAVHPDFRGKGVFKELRIHGLEYASRKGYHLTFNYPNDNSLPLSKSLGVCILGKIHWWVKILRPVSIVKGLIFDRKAEPLDIHDNYFVDPARLDSIAGKSAGYDGYVKINRIEGYHDWRYNKRPNRYYGMVLCGEGAKETAAIFSVNQKGINREMVVIDIIGSTRNTLKLLRKVTDAARQHEADFIALMNNPQFQTGELWKLGFIKKRLKNMVVLPFDIGLEKKLTNFSNWSLMAAMHDSV